MKIKIKAKDFKVSKKFEELVMKKLLRFEKYFNNETTANVLCRLENKTNILEISIKGNGFDIRSEVRGQNMYENLDIALPKIERQIIKFGQRKKDLRKLVEKSSEELLFLEEKPEVEDKKITKTKSFSLDPISVADAIALLDSTEHDFYVFLNNRSNKVNIVYNKKDGTVGHIKLDY